MHELIHRGNGMYPALYAHVKYFQSAYCVRFALSAPLQRVWTLVGHLSVQKTLRSVSHDRQQEDRETKLDAVAACVFLCNPEWQKC